jgi:phospholipase/carboxylesterase
VHESDSARFALLLLHGRGMRTEALEPFGRSMGLPAVVSVPAGPVQMPDGSRAWWPADLDARARQLEQGPRDLFDVYPDGRAPARAALAAAVERVRHRWPALPVALAGYSQGGMVAMDHLLLGDEPGIAACALMSSTRIALNDWQPRLSRLASMPMFVAHGRSDDELPFSAGERLRDLLVQGGAEVTWVPFDGGHEMPLLMWRRLRHFLLNVAFPRNAG